MEIEDKEKVKLKKRLARLLRRPDNKTCADCPEKRPTCISFIKPQKSFALGSKVMACFLCLECAGKHKELGLQICYVRDISHDEFEKGELKYAEYSGNGIVNKIFEGHLQKATSDLIGIKPPLGADSAKRERFIRQKYVDLYFYRKKSHYEQISKMKDALAISRKTTKVEKGKQSPGEKRRKNLSIFLNNSFNESKLSRCSITVGNTVSTPYSIDDNNKYSGPINASVGEQEKTDPDTNRKVRQERRTSSRGSTASRGRSRSNHRENSMHESDNRQESQNRNRSKSRTDRSKSRTNRSKSRERRGRRGRSISRTVVVIDNETDINSKDESKDRGRSKSRIRSSSKGRTAEIREKGQKSAMLRRPRSRSKHRTEETRRASLASDVGQNNHSDNRITKVRRKSDAKGSVRSQSKEDLPSTPVGDARRIRRIQRRKTPKNVNTTGDDANRIQNLDENSDEDGFTVIDSKSCGSQSSTHLDACWNNGGSFRKPFVKKKGIDAFKNRRRSSLACIETESNHRQLRKSEIFASLNRAGGCSRTSDLDNDKEDYLLRIAPQLSRSDDIRGTRDPQSSTSSSKRLSMKARNTSVRRKSSASATKLNLKPVARKSVTDQSRASNQNNRLLMEEWEKMKIENENNFVSFEKSFRHLNK